MATIVQKRQQFIRYYKQVTKAEDVDMDAVARLAEEMGWKMPQPIDPRKMLAKQFAEAAGEEVKVDKVTKRPYKANLAITGRTQSGQQTSLWIDVDEAPRHKVVKALHLFREHVINVTVIGVNTADHWNRLYPGQLPIPFDRDLTEDVEWRLNAPKQKAKKAS